MSSRTTTAIYRTSYAILGILLSWMVDSYTAHVAGAASDVCLASIFTAQCDPQSVIIVDSALYGRMQSGTCIRNPQGAMGCSADVLPYAEWRCSGRRRCEIVVPNAELKQASHASPEGCHEDLTSYLRISYHCQPVETASDRRCTDGQPLVLSSPSGYIANVITNETGKGSNICPWLIEAGPGQKVVITLHDFNAYDSSESRQRCYIYANIRQVSQTTGPSDVFCGGQTRERDVHSSDGSSVRVTILKPMEMRDAYFMFHYKVIGCADYIPPPDTSVVEQSADMVKVQCAGREDVNWQVVCVQNRWSDPTTMNCSLFPSAVKSGADGVPPGLLIIVVVGVALAISLITIAIGVMFLYRSKCVGGSSRNPPHPNRDNYPAIPAHHYPLPCYVHSKELYPMLAKSDRGVPERESDYATTLQMRQTAIPPGPGGSQYDPWADPGDLWACPVHGTLERRRLGSFRPRLEHIYESPYAFTESTPGVRSPRGNPSSPVSPFYHELDPTALEPVASGDEDSTPTSAAATP